MKNLQEEREGAHLRGNCAVRESLCTKIERRKGEKDQKLKIVWRSKPTLAGGGQSCDS